MKRFLLIILVCACMLATSLASARTTSTAPTHWRQIQGALGDYVRSRLPAGFVVYVFAPSGALVTVSTFNRTKGHESLGKLEHALRAHDFRGLKTRANAHTAQALRVYLSDQGYAMSDVVAKAARNSLLLVENEDSDKTCGDLRQFQQHREMEIRHATAQPPVDGGYAVTVLKLKASKPVVCANSRQTAKKILLERRAHHASPQGSPGVQPDRHG